MAEDRDRTTQDAPQPDRGEMSEAEIDNTLMETFPASDPPSWTLGTDHRADSPTEKSKGELPAGEPRAGRD